MLAHSRPCQRDPTYTYTYDGNGNRLTAVVTGASPSSQTLTYNAANQITNTGYSYDGAGNLTADSAGTYTYNGAEQMTKVTHGTSNYTYKYSGTSEAEVLQETTATGSAYNLVYGKTDQQGVPQVEQVKIGSAVGYVESDPTTGQPLMLRTTTGSEGLYVEDGTGNPIALIAESGYRAFEQSFDPYGTVTVTLDSGGWGSATNPYLFKGGIQDRTTGWVHFGNRWYNPASGEWTQEDTLDSPLDPANANRYAYAGGDPLNGYDPTGQSCASDVIFGAAGGLLREPHSRNLFLDLALSWASLPGHSRPLLQRSVRQSQSMAWQLPHNPAVR